MPPDRSPILHSQEIVKEKKPPACDSGKAERVLCHPTTDGTPCPRCLEEGNIYATNPVARVARRRTPTPDLGTVSAVNPAASGLSTGPNSASEELQAFPLCSTLNSNSLPFRQHLNLPPDLVHHLFECFTHLPHQSHPILRRDVIRDALCSVSWEIHLLPPQQKVLAHCIIAISASISFDHAIIGHGSQPASLEDRSVFALGADLRDYGVRRAPVYRALCAEAVRLACEVGILLEPSEDNAASCYILQCLEDEKDGRSRPWAVGYISHVRTLFGSLADTTKYNTSIWSGYLLMEVLETTLRRQPALISHHDQLLITGRDPLALHNLFLSIQSMVQARKDQPFVPFAIMQPYCFHVVRLARELYETITGDVARRHPLDERAITDFIASLNHLHAILALVFDHEEEIYPRDALFYPTTQRGLQMNLRSCAYIMTLSRAALLLGLHRELVRRAAPQSAPALENGVTAVDPWAAERLALLQRQVHEMANITMTDIARVLRFMPSPPHIPHVQRRNLITAWAEFCLEAADAAETVLPEHVATIETFSETLKLIGYSWPLPKGLIERLDAYVAPHPPTSSPGI
ncbi:Zn(2)-C6 fungal-type transcriptional factor [Mycena venus]|uniref:Zn(2)-C6 fungal-type transcriptional factor n=1 Tax=Mycena venus TaxID=2733690 RepID=A0A8H6Z0S0_9AGAR|nr:Zn(2)-C6 fungal-type transcriptional factor [Mycena venus]